MPLLFRLFLGVIFHTFFNRCVYFLQGTQRGSGTSHSSSSSQVGSSPKLERRQKSGLHRTVAAVGHTEPQQLISARFNGPTLSSSTEIGKLSELERTGSISLECDSPKDGDFLHDFADVGYSRTDIRAAVHGENSGPSAVSGNETVSGCKTTSYCKFHRHKLLPGRRPQSASDIDRCQYAADFCCASSSDSMSMLEERFNKTLEMNMKLAEKLATTCHQMEVLTMKLHEFEVDYSEFYIWHDMLQYLLSIYCMAVKSCLVTL